MKVGVLDTFIDKFKYLWQSGLDAHLFVDTKAGQAWCRLDVRLGHAPGPLHQQLHGEVFTLNLALAVMAQHDEEDENAEP